jgi:hypothetical protein
MSMLQSDYRQLQNTYDMQQKQRQESRGYQLENRIINQQVRDNDNIYLTLDIDHPNINSSAIPIGPTIGAAPISMDYTATKNIPILNRCSDYYCSVVKATIPLDELPIMIMPIVPNQADSDKTPLVIGINYNGTRYSQYLQYIADNTLTAPVQNATYQVITPYYYVYSFQVLIRMLNIALDAAYTASGIPALFPPGTVPSPYFYLEPTTNLISLICPKIFSELPAVAPLAAMPTIYMNTPLNTYIDSFQTSFQGYDKPFGQDYVFILNGVGYPTNNMGYAPFGVAATNPPSFYKFTQEYPTLEYWVSLRKIIIITNTIPVNLESVPTANIDINSQVPVLVALSPAVPSEAGQTRAILNYDPSPQYRLVDLISDNPLQTINIRVYWQDRSGDVYPLMLSVFQRASIKLGFFKKSLYNNV